MEFRCDIAVEGVGTRTIRYPAQPNMWTRVDLYSFMDRMFWETLGPRPSTYHFQIEDVDEHSHHIHVYGATRTLAVTLNALPGLSSELLRNERYGTRIPEKGRA